VTSTDDQFLEITTIGKKKDEMLSVQRRELSEVAKIWRDRASELIRVEKPTRVRRRTMKYLKWKSVGNVSSERTIV